MADGESRPTVTTHYREYFMNRMESCLIYVANSMELSPSSEVPSRPAT
jgi:hypothetical protein